MSPRRRYTLSEVWAVAYRAARASDLSHELAEDVAQEVALDTWLCPAATTRVQYNRARTVTARTMRRHGREVLVLDDAEEPSVPARVVEVLELREAGDLATRTLTPRQLSAVRAELGEEPEQPGHRRALGRARKRLDRHPRGKTA